MLGRKLAQGRVKLDPASWVEVTGSEAARDIAFHLIR